VTPVTARQITMAASAAWLEWSVGTPDEGATEPAQLLDDGAITQATFWDLVNRATPCACWSCDRQCGGSVDPGSCGPCEPDEIGRLLCDACRSMADVLDNDRYGIKVSANPYDGRVKIDPNVWDSLRSYMLSLSPATARALAARLLAVADQAEAGL
jgi:hypothetical protein